MWRLQWSVKTHSFLFFNNYTWKNFPLILVLVKMKIILLKITLKLSFEISHITGTNVPGLLVAGLVRWSLRKGARKPL